ncbi:hypothetical protein [Erythrobacter sp. KY5]|uniref:hypothetical protein n=1 Tax=Erythrobacter sp. KY5 TaxID=2011159 RepID=UPI0013A6DEFF|nr:hypothetical protein [Erythrobacter sp. KY5]
MNNTSSVLDLATKQPVVLTVGGRDRLVIADSNYFHHLEEVARRTLAGEMALDAVRANEMTEQDRTAFTNMRPSATELENDRWED